jgi:uncharacterized protein YqfB (UPF0267 family)
METYYQKEKQLKEQELEQRQPEAPDFLAYQNELSLEDKENILRDIYNSIHLFYKLVYEAKKGLESEKRNKIPVR